MYMYINQCHQYGQMPNLVLVHIPACAFAACVCTIVCVEKIYAGMSNLLYLEDVFVEVLLELLIGVVDAKLLKRVLLEHLKTKDVQHTNRIALRED